MTAEPPQTLRTDVGARLDTLPLTALHALAAIACAAGLAIDLAEVSLGNVLAAVLSAPPHRLDSLSLGWVLSGVYWGAVLGTPLVGWMASRRGVVRALQGVVLWLAVTTLLVASASDPIWLGVCRLLSGIALGAYPPLMIAYLTEIAPRRSRGALIFLVCALAYLAPPAAIFVVRTLTPLAPFGVEGWRWPFIGLGACALAAAAGFLTVPESPRWLALRRGAAAAEPAVRRFERSRVLQRAAARSAPDLVAPGAPGPQQRPAGRPWLFVSGIYVLHPWAVAAFPLLTGPVLLARGMQLADTLLYIAAASVGPALGTWCAGLLVDRLDRRITLLSCALLMLVSLVVFFVSDSTTALLSAVTAFGVGVALYTAAMTVYGAELFTTQLRTAATATAWAANRAMSALLPLLLLPLLQAHGPLLPAMIAGSALGLSALIIAARGPAAAAGLSVR